MTAAAAEICLEKHFRIFTAVETTTLTPLELCVDGGPDSSSTVCTTSLTHAHFGALTWCLIWA